MTNEEARAIMTALKQSYINLRTKSDLKKKTVKENIKAYDMAIKALEHDGVLQEIRQEIAESKYNHRGEYNRELVFNICLQIIDKKIKELSE